MALTTNQPLGVPQIRKSHWEHVWASQTSTNSYVDLGGSGTYWDKLGYEKATIQIWNTGVANDIDYNVLGSLNGVDYDIEIISETTLGEDNFHLIDISSFSEGAYIPYVKIQIKSTIADTHSTVEAIGVCI